MSRRQDVTSRQSAVKRISRALTRPAPIRRGQALELLRPGGNYLECATRIRERPASGTVRWPSHLEKRITRKPAAIDPSHVRQRREPAADHNARCSSIYNDDFRRSEQRRKPVAKERLSKQGQYRKVQCRVAVSIAWRNAFVQ